MNVKYTSAWTLCCDLTHTEIRMHVKHGIILCIKINYIVHCMLIKCIIYYFLCIRIRHKVFNLHQARFFVTIAVAGIIKMFILRCGGRCGSERRHSCLLNLKFIITPLIFKRNKNNRSKNPVSYLWSILNSLRGKERYINIEMKKKLIQVNPPYLIFSITTQKLSSDHV